MPSDIKSTLAGDDYRMRNYRAQISHHNEMELREIAQKHLEDTARLQDVFGEDQEKLRKGYEVQISREAEDLERKLHETRLKADTRLAEEKRVGDQELNQLKRATHAQIADYKKDSEARLDALRKQYQASTENLHAKARQSTRKMDKEV